MNRITGNFLIATNHGESVKAFIPAPLPPANPVLSPACYLEQNKAAELGLGLFIQLYREMNNKTNLVCIDLFAGCGDFSWQGAGRKSTKISSILSLNRFLL